MALNPNLMRRTQKIAEENDKARGLVVNGTRAEVAKQYNESAISLIDTAPLVSKTSTKPITFYETDKSQWTVNGNKGGSRISSSSPTALGIDDAESVKRKTKILTTRRDYLQSELSKYMSDAGGSAEAAERQKDVQNQLKIVTDALAELEGEQRVHDSVSKTRKDTFAGQTAANYELGRLTQDQSMAWNAYLDNPTDSNRRRAELLDAAVKNHQITNAAALDDKGQVAPWLSQSFANWVPQGIDQGKAQAKGALLGLAVSAPSVGAALSSGLYSYQTMRGSAFKRLMELGVDEETARTLASDEAFINGMLEAGDTYLDWLLFGGKAAGKALGKVLPGAASKAATATNAVTSVTGKFKSNLSKTAAAKAAKAISANFDKLPKWVKSGAKSLSAYLLNIPQEGGEEGAQEIVSMATDRLAQSDSASGNFLQRMQALGGNILDVGKDVFTGADPDAAAQVKEAAAEGMKIAAVSGGLKVGTGFVANRVLGTSGKEVDTATAQPYNETVSPAAAPEIQRAAEQAPAVQAANPNTDVLSTAQTAYLEAGVVAKIPKAKRNAQIVQNLVDGKTVSNEDIDKLALSTPKAREVFTKLTGVQFPNNAKLTPELLRNLARSAHTVAQEAQAQQQAVAETKAAFQAMQPEQQVTADDLAARAKQAREAVTPEAQQQAAQVMAQARGEIAPDGKPLLSYKQFVAEQKRRVGGDLTTQEMARLYDQYLNDNQTVSVDGHRLSKQKFTQIMREEILKNAPDADQLTAEERDSLIEGLWNQELNTQKQDGKDAAEHSMKHKEENNGRQDLVQRSGLSGQSDQSARGQGGRVSEAAGKAENNEGPQSGRDTRAQGRGKRSDLEVYSEVARKAEPAEVSGITVHEVPRSAYTEELEAIAARYEGTGANVHFVLEGYPVDDKGNYADGITIQHADGRKDIYLQILGATALEERADHELGHVAMFDNPDMKERAISALADSMSEDELLDLVNAYLPLYGAAYADSNDLIGDLLEEIICDAYAGLDRMNAGAPAHAAAITGVVEAQIQTYSPSYRQEGALTDGKGNLVVESDDKGHSRFSVSTYDESGRKILNDWMARAVAVGDLTQKDADDISRTMDLIYDICQEARGEYAPFDAWSEAKVVVNENGDPVFSVVKANGDYAMNLDFSLVCKKRRTLDAVLNELVKRGFVDNLSLGESQIVKINDLIRSYGFEVACDLCFVDAKRFRQGKVADDFVKIYNDMVKSLIPKGSDLSAHYFNFGGNSLVENAGAGIHELSNDQLDFTHINEVLKTKGEKTVEYKTAMLLKNSPADRKLTMRGDFLSTRGFDTINRENPRVLKLFNSKKGSGGPKSAVSDVQYLNEVLTSKTFNPEKAYAVGGVRIQSFSDYVPRMVFDYVQMIADLAAKKLPAHAYTKEQLFVKQFGLTGMKINMSLIPKIVDGGIAPGLDADGNYAWADESFDFEEAKRIQAAEGYSRNCGTIAVGVSDEHIRTLLADPEIRMVIPYHKSGLNPIVAKMNRIGEFVNYEKVQNTRRPDGGLGKKLDKDVAADKKLLDAMPNFNLDMRELGDPRAAAEKYVRWCEENNLLPKFDKFAYKQIDGVYVEKDGQKVIDENYYKLLEDFTVYDNGEYVAQSGLTMTFPDENSAFGSMKELIHQGLEEDAILEGKRTEMVPKIVDEIMKFSVANDWKPNLDSAEWDIVKSNMNNGRGTPLTGSDMMFFEKSKGKTVFGIYSTDDDTLLYASGGDTAVREHQFVESIKEARDNGQLTDTSTKGLRDFIKNARVRSAGNTGNSVQNGGSARSGGYAGVYAGQSGFHTSGALQNVLANIFSKDLDQRNSVTPQASDDESGASFMPKYSITRPDLSFADQVDLVKMNKLNEVLEPGTSGIAPDKLTNSAVYVAKEPNPLMQELGYGDLAIVTTQKHIRQMLGKREDAKGKVVNEHNHQLTPRQVKILPKLLERPAAVIRSTADRGDSLIFVTTEKDYKGRPIIIPVKANGTEVVYDGITGPAHIVTSMYGHDDFISMWNDAVKKNGVVFYNKERIDPVLESVAALSKTGTTPGIDPQAEIQVAEIDPLQVSPDTIVGEVQPKVKNPGERKFSITPAFEKWYKEQYGIDEDLTNSQLKRRLQTLERRAQKAEESARAAEFKHTFDTQNDLTAWMIHHTKKMREQKRESDAKLAAARKEKIAAVRGAVAEAKELERAKAAVQHDADRMAERRNAAKRLHTQENAYTQKVEGLKENLKLKRNAARATLRSADLAAKKRAKIEAEQGMVDTVRKDPKYRALTEERQTAAEKLRTLGRSAYRNFVNQAEAIDRFAKRQISDTRAGELVTLLGGTASTVERIFKDGLVNRAGDRIGGSMKETFLCWDDAGRKVDEDKQALLQDFMLHWHNIDRMSIETRAEAALETFELNNEWLRDMDKKELARLTAMTDTEAKKLGKEAAKAKALEYVQLLDRYLNAKNKPIFGDENGNSVSAETSQRIIDEYLAENPWLMEKANSIYEWWDQFMREWAVGDTISAAEYARMKQMYPHYAPTYRANKNGVGGAGFVGMGGASVSKAVKKAVGSHSEVMNIEDSFANMVSKIVRQNRMNLLYTNIIDTAMLDNDGTFADMAAFDWESSWQVGEYLEALMGDDLQEAVDANDAAGLEKVGQDYKLTAWHDGRKYTAFISEDLYKSIGNVTGHLANDLEKGLLKVGNALTGPMKTAITGINPAFAMRNLSRDVPTAVVNSISGMAFPKYWARAAKEMATNSENWKRFQALGGTHATYYNDSQGFAQSIAKGKNPVSWAVDKMGTFNEATESQTRFAEYLATIDRLGDTYENRIKGIKNAAEVTVDFSRKGRYGKVINAFVPYWNPAVQGIDKVVRSVIDSPDGSAIWKQASKTLGRAAMTTVLIEAIQHALLKYLDRDDEWEELSDRMKDTYYCIPLKDEKRFLKIPKNREWGAILGTPFSRMLEYADGRENPFENYIETAIEPNFLPPAIFRPDSGGGFTSDLIGVSQALDLAKNEDFAGRTIVPYAQQQGSLNQQFDNETSNWSKKLGELFNFSPMQLDYIIEDYFGDFGKLFTKATSTAHRESDQTTAEAILDLLKDPWVADARYSNQGVSKYYDLVDELGRVVQDKKIQLGNEAYKETIEYQTQKALEKLYGDQITELNREARNLPDGEEKDAVKAQIAELTREALEYYDSAMAGEIESPVLSAEYNDFSATVSNELIRLDSLSTEYKFKPTGTPSAKYTDPDDKKREYILDDAQKDYFKQLYREKYDEIFGEVINSQKYRKAKDEDKAYLLEDARDDVLTETKEEFFEWLKKSGARSVEKKKGTK